MRMEKYGAQRSKIHFLKELTLKNSINNDVIGEKVFQLRNIDIGFNSTTKIIISLLFRMDE